MGKTFLYTEMQTAVPFEDFDWQRANPALKTAPGLVNKTWLSGLGTKTLGGFYEFDSAENALAFAQGPFADLARQVGVPATTLMFDGDVVRDASVDIRSPFYG